jgi:uncharacterized protein YhhL (DUF1145 family)
LIIWKAKGLNIVYPFSEKVKQYWQCPLIIIIIINQDSSCLTILVNPGTNCLA